MKKTAKSQAYVTIILDSDDLTFDLNLFELTREDSGMDCIQLNAIYGAFSGETESRFGQSDLSLVEYVWNEEGPDRPLSWIRMEFKENSMAMALPRANIARLVFTVWPHTDFKTPTILNTNEKETQTWASLATTPKE
jgi:hypothetical protein